MPKYKSDDGINTELTRKDTYNFYLNKYFNLFMNKFKITGDIREEQVYFILRKLFFDGTIYALNVKETSTELNPYGELIFTPYATNFYNIYDLPQVVTPISLRGATFIPQTPQKVGVDGVVGWIQKNHKAIYTNVAFYLNKLTDVEMAIRVSLMAQKMPYLIRVTPENEDKLKRLFDRIKNDEFSLYVNGDEVNSFEVLTSNAPYIIDKLFSYKTALENELLTFLGIDNVGTIEKQEHLAVDEVNANNEHIAESGDIFLNCLKDFFNNVREVLGHNIQVEENKIKVEACKSNENKEDNDEDNEGGGEND